MTTPTEPTEPFEETVPVESGPPDAPVDPAESADAAPVPAPPELAPPAPVPAAPAIPVPHAPAPTVIAAQVAAHAVSAVAEPSDPPASWGRVDPDGTVYVRMSDGEVAVGSFQAGSPVEAMAYFTRKYDTLAMEVELLERRVSLPDVPPDESMAALKRVRDALATPTCVGDVEGLRARLQALVPVIDGRRAQARAARDQAKAEAKAVRERIVSDAEALADSVQWKVAGERLRELLDEWKTAPHVDRATEQALWKRFGAARNSFDRRRRQHFAQLSAQQSVVKAAKLKIIAEAEELSTSTEWGPTASRLRVLMDEWKAAGRLGRAEEDALWAKFRAVQDVFYAARTASFSERDAKLSGNLAAKEALLVEAEALLPVTDVAAAKAALRGVEERWEAAGHVPRSDQERVEGRLRRVAETVRKAEDTRWKRSNPEGLARAQDAVDQLQSVIAKLEADLAKAQASGDAKAAKNAQDALDARRVWLTGAESALSEFSAS
jgi:Domain of Unknown Function (DUF349)